MLWCRLWESTRAPHEHAHCFFKCLVLYQSRLLMRHSCLFIEAAWLWGFIGPRAVTLSDSRGESYCGQCSLLVWLSICFYWGIKKKEWLEKRLRNERGNWTTEGFVREYWSCVYLKFINTVQKVVLSENVWFLRLKWRLNISLVSVHTGLIVCSDFSLMLFWLLTCIILLWKILFVLYLLCFSFTS